MDSPKSAKTLKKLMKAPGLHMEDFLIPKSGYPSYNAFFIRDIKPGIRPIKSPNREDIVTSPADCILTMINSKLTLNSPLYTKLGHQLNVDALLNHSHYAKQFIGGTAVSCILMSDRYHHFHAPVFGKVVESAQLPGVRQLGMEFEDFFNKGNIGFNQSFTPVENFTRAYFIIKTKHYGYVAMIPIGLHTVSSLKINPKFQSIANSKDFQPIAKGEELGYFQYGGSLVILLFQTKHFPAIQTLIGQQIGFLEHPTV
jgi:phosphatidylserine decarboxylase